MCPPLLRFLVVHCALCLLLLVQHRCLSAALKSASPQDDNDSVNDENFDEKLSQDVMNAMGRDTNTTNTKIRHKGSNKRGKRLTRQVQDMKRRIKTLESEIKSLQRFVSKHQEEKCAKGLCPVGAVKYGCDCLLYVYQKLKWKEAAQYCAAMTGKLVSVTSKTMQKRIKNFLRAQLGSHGVRSVQIFTGLIYTTSTDTEPSYYGGKFGSGGADGWYWHGLQNVTKLGDYKNWVDDHPPASNSTAHHLHPSCMHLEGEKKLQWVSTHCSQAKRFICHFSAVHKRRSKRKQRRSRD